MLVILIEILLISIFPISLLRFGIIPSRFRLVVLALFFGIISVLFYTRDISLHNLGLRTDNLSPAVWMYVLAVSMAIVGLILLSKIVKTKSAGKWYQDPHFLFLFIPISSAQQFLFFGFILAELRSVFPAVLAVLITASIFGYMHTIYPRPLFSFCLGTFAGIFFSTLYIFYPNLIISSLAHSVLNFTAVYLAFFTFADKNNRPKKTELVWDFKN